MFDKVFLRGQLWPCPPVGAKQLTVATETIKVASLDIISRSLSALHIFFILDMGNIVVPVCFSDKDWRCLIIRFGFVLAPASVCASAFSAERQYEFVGT